LLASSIAISQTMAGLPVKVKGVITYNFVAR
jgi:hypothetical protein